MSKVIKQNYVAILSEKKIIQSMGELRPIQTKASEGEETATMRVVQEIAESMQKAEIMPDSVDPEAPAEIEEKTYDFRWHKEEADRILAAANAGKAKIYEDAYKAGMEEAKQELERRAAILEQEYTAKKDALEIDLTRSYKEKYNNELQRLEGKMVLWLQHMLQKLVGQAQKNEQVLIHLIRMGMQEISLQGDLIIRVSEEDLDYVLQNKAELTEELSEKLTIEVLKDKNLKKNQCIIETIMGNIECSLDVQLKGISDELRLIYESIMKNVNT